MNPDKTPSAEHNFSYITDGREEHYVMLDGSGCEMDADAVQARLNAAEDMRKLLVESKLFIRRFKGVYPKDLLARIDDVLNA